MKTVAKYLLQNQFVVGILLVAVAWIVIQIKDILVVLFIAYIVMAALKPFVNALRQKKVPKPFAVFLPYLITLFFIILLIFPLVPFFIAQIQSLISRFPSYVTQAADLLKLKVDNNQLDSFVGSQLSSIGRNVFGITKGLVAGVFSFLTVMVISFYLMLDEERLKKNISDLFPSRVRNNVYKTLLHIDEKLGAWVRGQILLSLFVGSITWVALTLFGFEFALPLAVIAGMLEIVPTIGPIIAAIPAVILALSISPATAALVAGLYVLIQVVENNVLVPKIMEKAVGLNPIVIILSVVVGGEVMGVLGALLSIPLLSLVIIVFKHVEDNA